MSDSLTAQKRSWNMSRIKGKDTKPEIIVRKYLFSEGFRFRKNDKRYPGKPDIILPRYKTAIFVHGCFWHRHNGCKMATMPKSNTDFWTEKFNKNIYNDQKHVAELTQMGWRVIIIWECEIKNNFNETMRRIISEIYTS